MNRITLGTTTLVLSLLAGGPALAASNEIHVTLSGHDASKEMHIALDRVTAAAGPVTFLVRNDSAAMEHEMIVAHVTAHDARLPLDSATGDVPEGNIEAIGEVPELKPGASGKITLDLVPGEYVLFCNVKGHYMAGMETPFVVK